MEIREQKQKSIGMMTGLVWQKCTSLLIVVLLLSLATPVSAQEKSADDWQFGTQVYLWGRNPEAAQCCW